MAAGATSPPDKFSLRWNDFPDNVTAIFRWRSGRRRQWPLSRQLRRDSGPLSDVTLVCQGGAKVDPVWSTLYICLHIT